MSVKIMGMVFDAQGLTPTQKLVLIALADHANDEGLSIYPSIATLARKTALSERAVQTNIRGLCKLGVVNVVGKSRRNTNEYNIVLEALVNLVQVHDVHQDPAGDAPPPLQEMHPDPAPDAPDPSFNHPDPSVKPSRAKTRAPEPPPAGGNENRKPIPNQERKQLEALFTELTGLQPKPPATEAARRENGRLWWTPLRDMIALANGTSPAVLREAVGRMRGDSLTIYSPQSVYKTFAAIVGEQKCGPGLDERTRLAQAELAKFRGPDE